VYHHYHRRHTQLTLLNKSRLRQCQHRSLYQSSCPLDRACPGYRQESHTPGPIPESHTPGPTPESHSPDSTPENHNLDTIWQSHNKAGFISRALPRRLFPSLWET
jgi:hypothetical protein